MSEGEGTVAWPKRACLGDGEGGSGGEKERLESQAVCWGEVGWRRNRSLEQENGSVACRVAGAQTKPAVVRIDV